MSLCKRRNTSSTTNGSHTWTGQTDVPLSETGRNELLDTAARYTYPHGDIYFSSPLLRCTQTLDIIYHREADILIPEFKECSLGILEGKPYTNLNDDPHYLAWINDPDKPIPEGESFNAFKERAARGFLKMLSLAAMGNADTAVAVMHGNVIRAILHRFADPAIPHDEWKIPNGGAYCLNVPCGRQAAAAWSAEPGFLFGGQREAAR